MKDKTKDGKAGIKKGGEDGVVATDERLEDSTAVEAAGDEDVAGRDELNQGSSSKKKKKPKTERLVVQGT